MSKGLIGLYGLSGLQVAILGGIGYGIYKAGRYVEREYLKIRSQANTIMDQAPSVVNGLERSISRVNSIVTSLERRIQYLN
jgi:hypothetical protein